MSATLKAPRVLPTFIPSGDLIRRIGSALRGAYEQRGAAKGIARDANADSRTAEAWLYGVSAMRSPELIRLMAANDQLADEINALVREIKERKKCEPASLNTASVAVASVMTVDRRGHSGSAC